MLKRTVTILLALALCAVALTGCSAKPKASAPAKADPAVLFGTWSIPETQNQRGALSDLTLRPDGTFRYAGHNALGGPVAFGGRYKVGVHGPTPWLELFYDDYKQPTVWFYQVSGKELVVSPDQTRLSGESALKFVRTQ